MTHGQTVMVMWSADSWDSLQMVHTELHISSVHNNTDLMFYCFQVQLFIFMPPLVREVALSGLMMCTVMALNVD